MEKTPKVSFLIPCKHRPEYLAQALFSCMIQTINEWEAVVVDDGDNNNEDIELCVKRMEDDRIVYVKGTGEGVGAAREKAVGIAKSNILITQDADDISYPVRAARCLEILDSKEPMCLYTKPRVFSGQMPSGKEKKLHLYNEELLLRFNFITNPGTAFTRKAYTIAGGYYERCLMIGEDYELFIRMSKAGVKFLAINEVHVCYRKHEFSATYAKKEEIMKNIDKIRRLHEISKFNDRILIDSLQEDYKEVFMNDKEMMTMWRYRE